MTEIQQPIKTDNGNPLLSEFVDFEIVNEVWDIHKLPDGSIVRSRVLLTGVMMDTTIKKIEAEIRSGKKPKLEMTIKHRSVFEVEPPQSLRGQPDPVTYTPQDLKPAIIDQDMNFNTVRQSWNIYQLSNGICIKLRMPLISVSKTSKFDSKGMPVYYIEFGIEMKAALPERLQKLSKEKTK